MDLVTYALSKKKAASAVSGVASYSVNGQTLIIKLTDGTILNMNFPDPNGISSMLIDSNNHLIATLDDNSTVDCGEIPSGTAAINIQKVTALPTSNISTSTIYLVASKDGSGNDIYEEYIYVDNNWERLGTQSANSGGGSSTDVPTSDIDSLFNS